MVEISFYALSFIAICMLLILFRSYTMGRVVVWFLTVVSVWVAYLLILDRTGVLQSFEFPPRIPALVVIPAIIAIIITINRKFMVEALKRVPWYVPVALQSFRVLVELLIYATYKKGIFPQRATFEGLNFDILVGISAIFMSIAVYRRVVGRKGLLTWNIASLGVLSLTVFSFISTYYFSDYRPLGLGYEFVTLPYLLLASVLLPVAIFLHAFSIKQL